MRRVIILIAAGSLLLTGCAREGNESGEAAQKPIPSNSANQIDTDNTAGGDGALPDEIYGTGDDDEGITAEVTIRQYRYSENELRGLLVTSADLPGAWSESPAEMELPSASEEDDDPLGRCLEDALPDMEVEGGLYEGRSVDGSSYASQTTGGMANVESTALNFYSAEIAREVYTGLGENAKVHDCLLNYTADLLQSSLAEEGLLVTSSTVERVTDLLPVGWGTAVDFVFLLSDGETVVPVNFSLILVGREDVLTMTSIVVFGESEYDFVIPMITATINKVRELVGEDAAPLDM
jgi:hypothetical protein